MAGLVPGQVRPDRSGGLNRSGRMLLCARFYLREAEAGTRRRVTGFLFRHGMRPHLPGEKCERRTLSGGPGFAPDAKAIYTMSIEYDLLPDLACAP